MAANKKSSKKTAVFKIIANWFSCPWRQLTPDLTLWLQTTPATLKSLQTKKCLNISLHHLKLGPLPCSLPSSQLQPGRGSSLGFPNPPTSFPARPPLAGNHAEAVVCQWPPKNEHTAHSRSPPLSPCQRAQMGCRFCFSFIPSPSEVHRLVLLRAGHLSQPPQLQLPSVLLTIFLWKGQEEIKMFWYKVFWIILMPTVLKTHIHLGHSENSGV